MESEHGARRARRWVWVLFALAPLMILAAVVVSLLVPQGTASFVLPPARQQDAAVVLGVAALAISTASLTWMVRAARSGPAVAAISSFSVHQHRQAAARIRRGERVPEAEVAVSTAVAWALVRLRKVIAVYLGVVLAAVAMALFLDSWWVLLLAGLGAVLVATSALIENRGAPSSGSPPTSSPDPPCVAAADARCASCSVRARRSARTPPPMVSAGRQA